MIIGDNGIITQAQRATLETSHANVKDRMQMKASEYQLAVTIDGLEKTFESYLKDDGIIDADNIVDVENLIGTSQTYGMGNNGKDLYKVIKNSTTMYTLEYIDKSGNEEDILVMNIANLSGNTIIDFETAQKHPDQTQTGDIGIAEDGTIVNLDLWYYIKNADGTYALGTLVGCSAERGYIGEIVDGKIIGKVPMYIKEVGYTDFGLVTELEYTFYCCIELVEAPEIPSSVTNMYETFSYCTNLKTAPKIPVGVTNMESTFSQCTNLIEAPEIPAGVTNMHYTFSGCTNLKITPKIPNSVTELKGTFIGCNSLTGTLEINASKVYYYSSCLSGAAINEGCNLVLTGTCPQLEEIYNTKSSNSKITLAQ